MGKTTKFISHSVLIIGEICDDIFYYCRVDRLSPEAPVPIVKVINEEKNSGMAGNLERNFRNLTDSSVNIQYIYPVGQIPIKKRYVDEKSNHYFLRVDENDSCKNIIFNEHNISKIKKASIIIISDYNKGFLKDDDIRSIRGFNKKAKIFIDTKKIISNTIYKNVDYIKINESELNMNLVTDSYLKKLAKPVNGTSGLIPHHKINKVIVTLGAKGAMHHNILYRQINPLSTIDVSGAGDTFLAALVASFIESNNISSSITYANKIARQVVSERGVSVASKN